MDYKWIVINNQGRHRLKVLKGSNFSTKSLVIVSMGCMDSLVGIHE